MKKAPYNSFIVNYWKANNRLIVAKRIRGNTSAICQEACMKETECTAVFDVFAGSLVTRNCKLLMGKPVHYERKCLRGGWIC
jgi:hypothetical protein